jgi:hypothetical protein
MRVVILSEREEQSKNQRLLLLASTISVMAAIM